MVADSKVRSLTIPPPVMGISSKQALSEMDPLFSPELLNVFGDNGALKRRRGTDWISAGGGPTGVTEFVTEAGSRYIFGTLEGEAYEYALNGSITSKTGAASLGTAEPYFAAFKNKLFFTLNDNTTDVYYWTGSGNITAAAFTGPGADDKAIVNIFAYKSRLYFIEYNAASIWYTSTVGAITGACTELDLTGELALGGKILWAGPISPAAGDRSQQLLAVVSEMGEVLVYQGDYPGSAAWSQIGVYYIAAPIGRKSFINWGSDVLVITDQGILSVLDVMASGSRSQYTYLTDEISGLFTSSIATMIALGAETFTITGIVYPKANMLVISTGGGYSYGGGQYVMNLQTRGWFRFDGWGGSCWTLYDGDLYFGTDSEIGGGLCQADVGTTDLHPLDQVNPENIRVIIRHAYNYFGDREATKQFTEAHPILDIETAMSLTIDVDVDFADTAPTSTTPTLATGAQIPRCGLKGVGQCASVRIEQNVTNQIFTIKATTVRWNDGGVA